MFNQSLFKDTHSNMTTNIATLSVVTKVDIAIYGQFNVVICQSDISNRQH